MLTINITPTFLIFKDLTDDLQQDIVKDFGFSFTYRKGKSYLEGTPEQLFKPLYLLATKYDIELI